MIELLCVFNHVMEGSLAMLIRKVLPYLITWQSDDDEFLQQKLYLNIF